MRYKRQSGKLLYLKGEINRLINEAENERDYYMKLTNEMAEIHAIKSADYFYDAYNDSKTECEILDQLLNQVDDMLDKQVHFCAEFDPNKKAYRIFDPKNPQETIAYENELPDGLPEIDPD